MYIHLKSIFRFTLISLVFRFYLPTLLLSSTSDKNGISAVTADLATRYPDNFAKCNSTLLLSFLISLVANRPKNRVGAVFSRNFRNRSFSRSVYSSSQHHGGACGCPLPTSSRCLPASYKPGELKFGVVIKRASTVTSQCQ